MTALTHVKSRFELEAISNEVDFEPVLPPAAGESEVGRFWNLPLRQLRDLASSISSKEQTPAQRKRTVYERSEAVRIYVLRRANGNCEGCEREAPFNNYKGQPYLEPHHIARIADQGPDHPEWVAALCPNCHRRVHFGAGPEILQRAGRRKNQADRIQAGFRLLKWATKRKIKTILEQHRIERNLKEFQEHFEKMQELLKTVREMQDRIF